MAINKTDTINGYINILHTPNNHTISVMLYENNEAPNTEHKSTFKKFRKIKDITIEKIKEGLSNQL